MPFGAFQILLFCVILGFLRPVQAR
jgi:hypothetical protein